jgi:dTMP kinase
MFFLDVEPQDALKRLQSRNDQEIFENLQDLVKVREKVLKLAGKWHVINASDSIEEVNIQISSILEK